MNTEQLLLHALLLGYEKTLKYCDDRAASLHRMYEAAVEEHGRDSAETKLWCDRLHDFVSFSANITHASHHVRRLLKATDGLDPLVIKDPAAFYQSLMILSFPVDREEYGTDPYLAEAKALLYAASKKKMNDGD